MSKAAFKIGIFLFFISTFLVQVYFIEKRDDVVVEIEADYSENDRFQLFFAFENAPGFIEERSYNYRIPSKSIAHKIIFRFENAERLTGLRFDLSSNPAQKTVPVRQIKVAKGEKVIYIKEKDLVPNEYIHQKGMEFELFKVGDKFDPFLVYSDQKALSYLYSKSTKDYVLYASISFILTVLFYYFLKNRSQLPRLDTAYLLIGTFCGFIFIVFILNSIHQPVEYSEIEKRKLAGKPDFSFSTGFFKDYESYINDQFVFRNSWTKMHSKFQIEVLKSSPFPEKVLLGEDYFLFGNSEEAVRSYSRTNLLKQEDLKAVVSSFSEREKSLNAQDISYFFGFFPNKHSVYSDYLPGAMKKQIRDTISLGEQLEEAFSGAEMKFFNPTAALLNKKEDLLLYLKLDSHWNNDGAYVVYADFFLKNPELDILPLNRETDFDVRYVDRHWGDLTQLLGIENYRGFIEKRPLYELINEAFRFKRIPPENLPDLSVYTVNNNLNKTKKLLFFGDSFSDNIITFFSLHFKEAIYIRGSFNQKLVNELNPDVVIEIPVERFIYKHLPGGRRNNP